MAFDDDSVEAVTIRVESIRFSEGIYHQWNARVKTAAGWATMQSVQWFENREDAHWAARQVFDALGCTRPGFDGTTLREDEGYVNRLDRIEAKIDDLIGHIRDGTSVPLAGSPDGDTLPPPYLGSRPDPYEPDGQRIRATGSQWVAPTGDDHGKAP